MVRSPFTFYRGAALTMAADLASTPSTGIQVQCCGDAHLCNFGGFATSERRVLFSINDLDDTLPAPWKWDLKRLAASFMVASVNNGLTVGAAEDVVMACVRAYRKSMAEFSQLNPLELWHQGMWARDLVPSLPPKLRRLATRHIEKERTKSRGEQMLSKLAELRRDVPVIKDQPPTIFHDTRVPPGKINQALRDTFAAYRATLPTSYQSLLDLYRLRDAAIKVVGVGSVGTSCWVLLLTTGDGHPLFLQAKEARASVLEPYAGKSLFPNHGQRVVEGYRRMQPASDMFLGWSQSPTHHFVVRQLRDMKLSVMVETFGQADMHIFGRWCGRALALSHARSGSSAILSGYRARATPSTGPSRPSQGPTPGRMRRTMRLSTRRFATARSTQWSRNDDEERDSVRLRGGCVALRRVAAFCTPSSQNPSRMELFRASGATTHLRRLGISLGCRLNEGIRSGCGPVRFSQHATGAKTINQFADPCLPAFETTRDRGLVPGDPGIQGQSALPAQRLAGWSLPCCWAGHILPVILITAHHAPEARDLTALGSCRWRG
jgi:uncharacterized protein (DUF2252 family)